MPAILQSFFFIFEICILQYAIKINNLLQVKGIPDIPVSHHKELCNFAARIVIEYQVDIPYVCILAY